MDSGQRGEKSFCCEVAEVRFIATTIYFRFAAPCVVGLPVHDFSVLGDSGAHYAQSESLFKSHGLVVAK